MWEAIMFAINIAWKLLAVAAAWMVFKYIMRDGKDTVADLLETIGMAIHAGSLTLKRKLWAKIKKENKGPVNTEGSVE